MHAVTRPWIAFVAGGALALLVVSVATTVGSDRPATSPASPSPAARPNDGALVARSASDLPATVRPYPYTTPTPAPRRTEIDGTYLRVLTLDDVGGPQHGLPFPCARCLPYVPDAGVSTLILFEGMYFINHQISGFRSTGHYVIEGDTLTLFNDPNCTRLRGTYIWRLAGLDLRLRVLDDTCAFEGERATDLTAGRWTKIPVCRREVQHLWPGILGC